ncbi:MAG: hypothetical protein ACKOQ2_34760, partial [Dolichospermum sp.]
DGLSIMGNKYEQQLEVFMSEADVISKYLRQKIQDKTISQALYVSMIQRFIESYENLKCLREERNSES